MSQHESCEIEKLFARYLKLLDAGHDDQAAALLDAHPDLAMCREVERRVAEMVLGQVSLSGVANDVPSSAALSGSAATGAEDSGKVVGVESGRGGADLVKPIEALSDLPPRYEIIEPIGSGGMGQVFRAFDKHLEREVAIKFPLSWQSALQKDLLNEARLAARLRSAYICPVHDIGMAGEVPFISMAFIHGQPLNKWRRGRNVTVRAACRLIQHLAQGFSVAHQGGIIHRDVKSANIMIDEHGLPFIMDFGLAHYPLAVDAVSEVVAGSPSYMAPEQIVRPDHIGWATDIYGLGVVFYELLTGQVPFHGSVPSVWTQIVMDSPQSPRRFRPEIPEDVERLCLSMLSKSPAARPASMQQVSDQLQGILEGGNDLAAVANSADGSSAPDDSTAQRRGGAAKHINRWWVAGLVTLAALLIWHIPRQGVVPEGPRERGMSPHVIAEHVGILDPRNEGWHSEGKVNGILGAGITRLNMSRGDYRAWTLNADDNRTTCLYARKLSVDELDTMRRDGWRLSGRVAVEFSQSRWATQMTVYDGKQAHSVFLQREKGSPDIIVRVRGREDGWTLPLGGGYHDYVLTVGPGSSRATLTIDGQVIVKDHPPGVMLGPKQVQFGAGDTQRRSITHWESVKLETLRR